VAVGVKFPSQRNVDLTLRALVAEKNIFYSHSFDFTATATVHAAGRVI
jgi:hypothetical protein